MRASSRRYASLTALALVLLVCLAALPSRASAQAPTITITGAGVGQCPDGPAAAGPQGTIFQVSMADFPFPLAGGYVTITRPDGSIFTMAPLEPIPGGFPPLIFPDLAPIAPPAVPLPIAAAPPPLSAVDAARQILTGPGWPTGCYRVTVAASVPPGVPSPVVRATRWFRVQPAIFPAQPANLQLTVRAAGTIQPSAVQPLIPAPIAVDIIGLGAIGAIAPPNLTLSLIRPDGSIFAPIPFAPSGSPGGFASLAFLLPPGSPPGTYTFVATTLAGAPLVPTASTRAQFTVTAAPNVPQGNAVLAMNPFNTIVNHPGTAVAVPAVTIQGRNLFMLPGGVGVTPVLVLPDGTRLAAPALAPDGNGNLLAFPPFFINRHYPTGVYRLEMIQTPVPAALLASISFRVVNP